MFCAIPTVKFAKLTERSMFSVCNINKVVANNKIPIICNQIIDLVSYVIEKRCMPRCHSQKRLKKGIQMSQKSWGKGQRKMKVNFGGVIVSGIIGDKVEI